MGPISQNCRIEKFKRLPDIGNFSITISYYDRLPLGLSWQIEENNRMGKTRDLIKKIRDTKGTFHAEMGSIKDRKGMDLTETEDIKKRWQNTQKNCTKKNFKTQHQSLFQ